MRLLICCFPLARGHPKGELALMQFLVVMLPFVFPQETAERWVESESEKEMVHKQGSLRGGQEEICESVHVLKTMN